MPTKTDTYISCKIVLYTVAGRLIARLPEDASLLLPTRGQVMVEGFCNETPIKLPLEPDGRHSHWFEPTIELLKACKAKDGSMLVLRLKPTKDWVEPVIPKALISALKADPKVAALWEQITPMARWEWVRWSGATNNPETYKKRLEVAVSKLSHDTRRPCCWNRNLCTDMSVSKSGILILPS